MCPLTWRWWMRWPPCWTRACRVSAGRPPACSYEASACPCQPSRHRSSVHHRPLSWSHTPAAVAVVDSYESGRLLGNLSISDLRGCLPEHFEQVRASAVLRRRCRGHLQATAGPAKSLISSHHSSPTQQTPTHPQPDVGACGRVPPQQRLAGQPALAALWSGRCARLAPLLRGGRGVWHQVPGQPAARAQPGSLHAAGTRAAGAGRVGGDPLCTGHPPCHAAARHPLCAHSP